MFLNLRDSLLLNGGVEFMYDNLPSVSILLVVTASDAIQFWSPQSTDIHLCNSQIRQKSLWTKRLKHSLKNTLTTSLY